MLGKNYSVLFIGFVAASIVTTLSQWLGWNNVHAATKPLMLLLLGVWFFLNTRAYGNRFTLLIQVGLFFSLLGDIALLYSKTDEFFFLVGLAMFLIALLCYAIGFALNLSGAKAPWQGVIMPTLLTIFVFAFAYWYSGMLMPRVDADIKGAIWAYLTIISMMFAFAAFRWQRTYKRSWILVMLGAAFFVLSDTLLSYDRFVEPFADSSLAILGTYALAQGLIAIGCVWHVRSPTHVRQQQMLQV